MGNLAYENFETRNELSELNKVRNIDRNYTIKSESNKMYLVFLAHLVILLILGITYTSGVAKKTNVSIKIEKLISEENDLKADVNMLKAEYDIAIDLNQVEKRARNDLNMDFIDEIKYIKFN
ncbi:MAG: hypothetical protein B6I28_05530 [Fusobacteriia bacterium 4572_132]|nr:MAG: hypothetical protein B6I28_05530 [Fusobacteriia bacterium 4572_132]